MVIQTGHTTLDHDANNRTGLMELGERFQLQPGGPFNSSTQWFCCLAHVVRLPVKVMFLGDDRR